MIKVLGGRKEGAFYMARNESALALNGVLKYQVFEDKCGRINAGGPNIDIIAEGLNLNHISCLIVEKNDIVEKVFYKDSTFPDDYLSISNVQENIGEVNEKCAMKKEIDKKELYEFANALLNEVNPITGEILSEDKLISSNEFKEIVSIAKKILESQLNSNKPRCAGVKWTEEELETVKKEYLSDVDVKEIARRHNRTNGAIKSVLVKLAFEKESNDSQYNRVKE